MAARRCSLCGLDYPTSVMRCHVCGSDTDWMNSIVPDPDWQHDVDVRLQLQTVPASDGVGRNRLLRCLTLGYDVAMAESIAASDADIHVLEYRLIRRGCPLPLAARIV